MKKKIKVPNTWDECVTKEQKEAFKSHLEELAKKDTYRPFDEVYPDMK